MRGINLRRWYVDHPTIDWLPPGELQGDALLDLQTKGNSLSIYEIQNDSQEYRVAIALAATRKTIGKFDYAIFEDGQFENLGLTPILIEGQTPDTLVNSLHYDLKDLTARNVVRLAAVISRGRSDRILGKDVKGRLVDAINSGTINKTKMKPELLGSLF